MGKNNSFLVNFKDLHDGGSVEVYQDNGTPEWPLLTGEDPAESKRQFLLATFAFANTSAIQAKGKTHIVSTGINHEKMVHVGTLTSTDTAPFRTNKPLGLDGLRLAALQRFFSIS